MKKNGNGWMTRRRMSSEANVNGCCVVCGKLMDMESLSLVTEYNLLQAQQLLRRRDCYKHVPDCRFEYGVGHSRPDGLVLDPEGFVKLEEGEGMDGAPVAARMCGRCRTHLCKNKLPPEVLANSLWTGAGMVKELLDLSWVEEKLISCVHVSVQVQKCRPVRNWKWDSFYPQAKVKGHIITYPADPGIVLR
jgi:hypothetical protein